MFNRKASRRKNKADEIVRTLTIQPGFTVADIGSGGGFFTFLFSVLVRDKGTVYAIDTNDEFLEYINQQKLERGLTNVKTVLATEKCIPPLPLSIDLFFVRNVYHHLEHRIEYFSQAKRLLSSRGRIAIIEYSDSGQPWSFHRRCGHNVPVELIIEEMNKAGFIISASFDYLKTQSFTIFVPKTS